MSTPVITVENLSKAYRIGLKEEIPDTITGALLGWVKSPVRNFEKLRRLDTFRHNGHGAANGQADDIIWALKDVSFEVHEGEVLGIIGRNGAGKSTLLKILSRITEPTSGQAVIRGRVSSLLEVGTGFHPEMTGRENIYMNGTILGMRKREIDRKFDEIVDFSGVEKFLDTPIKRYSSGMNVRLAFAVAAHLEPEILIIDEVLAVGDAEFQKKCLGKMQDVAGSGRTVLFVSHNMAAVRNLTNTGVFLHDGSIRHFGRTSGTIDAYLADAVTSVVQSGGADIDRYRRNRSFESVVRFRSVRLGSEKTGNGHLPTIASDQSVIKIILQLESHISVSGACLSLAIVRNQEQRVTTIFSKDAAFDIHLSPGVQNVTCTIPGLTLAPGFYTVDCGINTNAVATALDVLLDYPLFEVEMPIALSGELEWPHRPWGALHCKNVMWEMT